MRYASRRDKGQVVELIVIGAADGELEVPTADDWHELLVRLAAGCPNALVTDPAGSWQ